MSKKGISPLVSTVLIVAMVIVIAMIIFMFSGRLVKKTTVNSQEMGQDQIMCYSGLLFSLKSACAKGPGAVSLIMENNGQKDISSFGVRVYLSNSDVDEYKINGLDVGELDTKLLNGLDVSDVKKLEIYPSLRKGFKRWVCVDNIVSFEVSEGNKLVSC